MTQPDRPISLAIVGPAWGHGGTEQFAHTLARFMDPSRIRLDAIACTDPSLCDEHARRTAPVPVLLPNVYALNRELAAYDALLIWGIDTDTWLAPSDTQARIWIAHGASHWTQSTMAGSVNTTDHTVCVSKHVADTLILREAHTIIVNGIDTARLTHTQTRTANRIEWGIPPKALVLGYVGRLAEEKGPQHVVRAIPHLPKGAHALICGAGVMLDELIAEADDIAPDHVHFIHTDNYMGDVYGAMTALAVPSAHEGFGLAAAEAMYLGTPVIMTKTGLAADYIIDHHNGIISLPDPQRIATAALEIFTHHLLKSEIRDQAHELAMTEFMGRRMAAEYMDLIENVVGSKINVLA